MPKLANRLLKRNRNKGKIARKLGKSRVPRGVRGGLNDFGQMATIKETVAFQDLDPNLGYNFNFNLSQFVRASALAPNFKFYKAKSVEWCIEPLYNTFQDGTTGGEVTIPYMYLTMNRTQDSTGINLPDIQAMGAKPQKLVGRKVIRYVPNWCSPGLIAVQFLGPSGGNAQSTYGLQKQFSYLACPDTNLGMNNGSAFIPSSAPNQNIPFSNAPAMTMFANKVVYNGHTVWVDQEVATGTLQPVARVTCTVTWHFKDPHYTTAPDPTAYRTIAPQPCECLPKAETTSI